MDFNADKFLIKVIDDLCDKDYKPTIPEWRYWKFLTERMLRWMSVEEVVNNVLKIVNIISDKDWVNEYPKEIFKEEPKESKKKVYGKLKFLDIIETAKKYGLEVRNNKCICPFHSDTDPSLVFYPETNSYFCFGCRDGGNVLKFIKKMEDKK